MASKSPQSHAKRAREMAVREKRELKRAKKAAAKEQAAQPDQDAIETDTAAPEESDDLD